jgi:hypothetical protein
MLNDLAGYFKRNVRKMSEYETKKALNEIKQIEKILQQNLKMRGAV